MRLVIATGIYPPDHGGPATFVPALAAQALEKGWEVEVVTLADDVGATRDDRWPVTRISRHQVKPIRVLRTVLTLTKALRCSDVLFSNGLFEESALASRLTRSPWAAKFVGDPVWEKYRNQHPDGLSFTEFNQIQLTTRNRLRRKALIRALQTSSICLTPSCELADFLKRWDVLPVYFVPNGVEIFPVCMETAEFDVVTVSRLIPIKNIDVLIQACNAINVNLLIVGDGPLRKDLERLAHSYERVTTAFCGHINAHEVSRVIDRARIFVLNSSHEGMSFALLEAMSRKKPVVVGRNAGNVAVVKDGVNGLVVDPRSIDEVSQAITSLLSNPEKAADLAQQARATVEEGFSIDSTLRTTLDFIEQVSNGNC